MTRCRVFILAGLAVLAPLFASSLVAQSTPPFPHARHARLFPTCAGCHAGITSGDASRAFPARALCATCHDGTIKPAVTWSAPVRRGAGLLVFSHPTHITKAKDVTCLSCHAADGAQWMDVSKAPPERCISCHTHTATGHLADDNKCATCHRVLAAASGLTEARIAALPKPASHLAAGFGSAHGAAATATSANCAMCHARESCARCHVDAGRSKVIQALASDARVARTVAGKVPAYPRPATHTAADFQLAHGTQARAAGANCATCHARASCESCHIGDGARDVVKQLPSGRDVAAPGVQLHRGGTDSPGVRVHVSGFRTTHARVAASGELQCSNCHAQTFCSTCHAGERVSRGYHPANFVSTHAPQAYARETNCSSCHSAQAFCRGCHQQAGLAVKSSTQRSPLFHNARPLWLLQHGRAARQDLMSCATCHQQTYCMQCHSDLGSRVNPHGPGFDASRMAGRNSQICLACHFKNPLGK